MPYRVENNCVQVNHGGHWTTVPGGCHKTAEEAKRHMRAIEANTHGKAAAAILHAIKIGRVLSAANESEIRSAVNALISVLARAGIDVQEKTMNENELVEKIKQLDPDTAEQIVTLVNEFVGKLDTELGITEAVQANQEQPPAENENPDEAAQEKPADETPQEDMHEGEMPPDKMPPKKKPPERKATEKMVMRPTQAETNYTPDSAGTEHCASCRWFHQMEGAPGCHLIENYPLDIQPTGYCDRHEALPAMTNEPAPIPVTIVETAQMAVREEKESTQRTQRGKDAEGLVQKVKNLFTPNSQSLTPDPSFQVFKGADNRTYWLARHTNMFEDRDQEILSKAAHERYIARVNLGLVEPPELWMYHTKGTRHGQADAVWEYAGFVFAFGHFDDTPEGKRAVKYYQRHAGAIELSHGFTYPSWAFKDGVYDTYNTFEISTLPPGAAANPYTTFEEIEVMALSDKQRAYIAEVAGQEAVERIERAQASAEKDAQSLIAQDKRYKDFADTVKDNGTDTVQIDLKQVLKVVAQLIDAQGDVDARLEVATKETTAQKTARENVETELKSVKAALEEMRAQMKLRPRLASRATETDIEGGNVLSEALKKVNEDEYEMHPTWGRIKAKRDNNS